jgi:hypothetical protein
VAVLAGVIVLIAGHILIWLIDGRLRRNLVIRLREKARLFELKQGANMIREDGLFLMADQRAKFTMKEAPPANLASTKKTFKEGEPLLEESQAPPEEAKKEEQKKKRKVQPMKKRIFEDEDEEDSSSDDEDMIKNLKLGNGGEEDDEAIKA